MFLLPRIHHRRARGQYCRGHYHQPAAPLAGDICRSGEIPCRPRQSGKFPIISAIATQLFTEKGYGKTTMEDIVRTAGVSRPIVYDLAGSKAELHLCVFENAADELRVRISSAIAASGEHGDPMAALRAAISTMFDHADSNPAVLNFVMSGSGDPELDRRVAEIRDRTRHDMADLLALAAQAAGADIDRDRIHVLVHAVHGTCEYAAHWRTGNKPGLAMSTLSAWMIESSIQEYAPCSSSPPPRDRAYPMPRHYLVSVSRASERTHTRDAAAR
ncbi:TetR/AcrR family transcriptional regulator [Nocardia brasiliensis]|uniref:TetR/AcrR family transcriptional regulator n=1 Tax=Nocardia brasiliensis TaxID=37326 RepID=UPI0037BA37CA